MTRFNWRFAALIAVTAVLVLLFTLMDIDGLFVYLPRTVAAVVGFSLVLPFVFWHRRSALACAAIVIIVPIGLKPVRWNTLKSFYIDADELRPGMTLEEVRKRMDPYLEVGRDDMSDVEAPMGIFSAGMLGAEETDGERSSRMLFIPDEVNYADWCVVYPVQGRISRIEIHPD